MTARLTIERMTEADVDEVMEIDRLSFPTAWHRQSYISDMRNRASHYFVVRSDDGHVAAYAGMWLVRGEAHVTTIAVHPAHRRRGTGRRLMEHVIRHALEQGAERMTLEVREFNTGARRLYEQLGFRVVGKLRGYYIDTGDNALGMELAPVGLPTVEQLEVARP